MTKSIEIMIKVLNKKLDELENEIFKDWPTDGSFRQVKSGFRFNDCLDITITNVTINNN